MLNVLCRNEDLRILAPSIFVMVWCAVFFGASPLTMAPLYPYIGKWGIYIVMMGIGFVLPIRLSDRLHARLGRVDRPRPDLTVPYVLVLVSSIAIAVGLFKTLS